MDVRKERIGIYEKYKTYVGMVRPREDIERASP